MSILTVYSESTLGTHATGAVRVGLFVNGPIRCLCRLAVIADLVFLIYGVSFVQEDTVEQKQFGHGSPSHHRRYVHRRSNGPARGAQG